MAEQVPVEGTMDLRDFLMAQIDDLFVDLIRAMKENTDKITGYDVPALADQLEEINETTQRIVDGLLMLALLETATEEEEE